MANKCSPCNEVSQMVSTIPTISQTCVPCDPCGSTSTVVYNQSACASAIPQPSSCTSGCGCEAPQLYAEIDSDFTFPAQGFGVTVAISNVKLAVGQAITSTSYGVLYVKAIVDACNGYYELENRDISDAMLIGRPVPCGTIFFLGSPSTIATFGSSGSCNALTVDFTVPAIGETAVATVQSLAGYALNDKVIIRSKANPSVAYTFILAGFNGVNQLILRNDGEGGVAYSAIHAGNDEVWEWCVESLSDQSLCEQAVSNTCIKYLLGCDVDGNIVKLTGSAENEVPIYDTTCAGYTNKIIPEATVCVTLVTCFQLSVEESCVGTVIHMTTSDDAKLLAEAASVLLSENAQPIINICDKSFYIDLDVSVVGDIVIRSNHEITETEYYDEACLVCIPADCCEQCNPQIVYPDPLYFPPGRDSSMVVAIPYALLSAIAEYKFSFVKNLALTANYILLHDNTTNAVIAAYDDVGTPMAIPADVDILAYDKYIIYEHDTACPVDAQYDRDVNVQIANIPADVMCQYNHNSQVVVYPCLTPDVLGTEISATQMSSTALFIGPSVQSAVSSDVEPWGIPLPPGNFHIYGMEAMYNRRTVALFNQQTIYIKTRAYLLVNVIAIPTPGDFLYVQINSSEMFKTARI